MCLAQLDKMKPFVTEDYDDYEDLWTSSKDRKVIYCPSCDEDYEEEFEDEYTGEFLAAHICSNNCDSDVFVKNAQGLEYCSECDDYYEPEYHDHLVYRHQSLIAV